MKKLLIFTATFLFAKNIYLIAPFNLNQNNSVTFEDKDNKIITYIQKLKKIDLNKVKETFKSAKKDLCSSMTIRKSLKNGYMIEFIYLDDKNSVIMRFTECE